MMPRRQRILLVDDNPALLEGMKEALEGSYEIGTALSGREAQEYLGRCVPDLVLLDMILPDANGQEICGRMKEDDRLKDIPVIFVTSIDDLEQKARSFDLGLRTMSPSPSTSWS